MQCGACYVGHLLVVCLGWMAMHVGYSSWELSTNASSSDSDCELPSPSVGSHGMANVMGVFVDASSHKSFEAHEQSIHSVMCRFREGAMSGL